MGGVLGPGEELMQIVPVEDELSSNAASAPPTSLASRRVWYANIRFDPFDYTIYGAAPGKVVYVSADTLKEESEHGTQCTTACTSSRTVRPFERPPADSSRSSPV